jgi:hypothetical protein
VVISGGFKHSSQVITCMQRQMQARGALQALTQGVARFPHPRARLALTPPPMFGNGMRESWPAWSAPTADPSAPLALVPLLRSPPHRVRTAPPTAPPPSRPPDPPLFVPAEQLIVPAPLVAPLPLQGTPVPCLRPPPRPSDPRPAVHCNPILQCTEARTRAATVKAKSAGIPRHGRAAQDVMVKTQVRMCGGHGGRQQRRVVPQLCGGV